MVSLTIAAKEFKGFLSSAVAYIFLAAFILWLNGSYFVWQKLGTTYNFFTVQSTVLDVWFSMVPMAFVLLVPAHAMKLWPDELKTGTIELLMSYPVKTRQIVMGKFLAGLFLILVGLALTLVVPWTVGQYGELDRGPVIGAYLASALVGGAFLAVGLFMGALCREQVTAFIVTALICLALVLMGDTLTNLFLPQSWHGITNALSFSVRFDDLGRGVANFPSVIYFLSFTVVCLVLNVAVVECRKGR